MASTSPTRCASRGAFTAAIVTATIFAATIFATPFQAPLLAEPIPLGDLFTGEFTASSNPGFYTAIGGTTVFVAADQAHGSELWKTDGTALGTELVLDIRPGSVGSSIREVTRFGAWVYFSAQDLGSGQELWRTDGTSEGTERVQDIWPGPGSSDPRDLTVFGDSLIFSARTAEAGRELWKLPPDGPAEMIVDLEPGADGSNARDLLPMASTYVAFSVYTDAVGWELGLTDGTAGGTQIFDIHPTGSSIARPLGAASDFLLYFEARTDDFGEEIWTLSPSSGTTNRISDTMPGADSSNPLHAIVVTTNLLVNLETPDGRKLFRSFLGQSVQEVTPLSPIGPVRLGTSILFVAGGDLWISNGNPGNAELLATPNIQQVFVAGESAYLIRHDNLTYFFGDGGLWSTNGTSAGTGLVDSSTWSFASSLQSTGDELFASLDDGFTGTEPWILNGSNLQRFANLNRNLGNSLSTEFTVAGDRVYFAAELDGVGRELASWDGSAAQATLVEDLRPGADGARPEDLVTAGTSLYFNAFVPGFGDELLRLDDAQIGSTVIDVEMGASSSNAEPFAPQGDEVFFTVRDASSVEQLWITDDGVPVPLSSFGGGVTDGVSSFDAPARLGDTLIFLAEDDSSGEELWKSDGTSVSIVTDLLPGPSSSNPFQLFGHDGWVYWNGNDGLLGPYLWRSDGTAQNTSAITADAYPLLSVGGELLIGKNDVNTGFELWKTDSTPEGTELVKDLWPGPQSGLIAFNPSYRASTATRGFFTAANATHGHELWTSDGSAAGTRMVRDLVPGPASSFPQELTPLPNGDLVFTAYTPEAGWELWRTDGTSPGTFRVSDIVAGSGSSEPEQLTVFGDWIVFEARSESAGREPWAYDWTASPFLFGDDFESGDTSAWTASQ